MSPFSFSRRKTPVPSPRGASSRRPGFEYLAPETIYLDSACQTLRPQPVIDALTDYYLHYNACGERVKYEWGRKVDAAVAATREKVLRAFALPAKRYTVSFTMNTTYGLNLLLGQLPAGKYSRILTTHTEHNSVFLSTMTAATRLGIPRQVLSHAADGAVEYADATLDGALVVLSAMNNFDGTPTPNLGALIDDVHRAGGAVIVDAAQAAPHDMGLLRGLRPDAFCFSAHKVYGASLGVVVAANPLIESLEISFLGGGQVANVTETGYDLLPELETRLEAGLQAWGEIIALGAALDWVESLRARGDDLEAGEGALAERLYDGLSAMPNLQMVGSHPASVMSVIPTRVDGHQLATFLSKAGVMVRSGYFCAHHWLLEVNDYRPLVRFSLGAHNTGQDIDTTLQIMGRFMKGL